MKRLASRTFRRADLVPSRRHPVRVWINVWADIKRAHLSADRLDYRKNAIGRDNAGTYPLRDSLRLDTDTPRHRSRSVTHLDYLPQVHAAKVSETFPFGQAFLSVTFAVSCRIIKP